MERRRSHRLMAFSLLGSGAVHAVLLSAIRLPRAEIERPGAGDAMAVGDALRVIRIRETALPVVEASPVPRPEPAPTNRSPPPLDEAAVADPGPLPETGARESPRSRLRPGSTDPRLWAWDSVDVRLPPSSDAGGERALPAEGMGPWADGDGPARRWGLSADGLHLGGIVLPLCSDRFVGSTCGLGLAPGDRDESRARLHMILELQRDAQRAAIRERGEAIRARRDSVRDSVPSRD